MAVNNNKGKNNNNNTVTASVDFQTNGVSKVLSDLKKMRASVQSQQAQLNGSKSYLKRMNFSNATFSRLYSSSTEEGRKYRTARMETLSHQQNSKLIDIGLKQSSESYIAKDAELLKQKNDYIRRRIDTIQKSKGYEEEIHKKKEQEFTKKEAEIKAENDLIDKRRNISDGKQALKESNSLYKYNNPEYVASEVRILEGKAKTQNEINKSYQESEQYYNDILAKESQRIVKEKATLQAKIKLVDKEKELNLLRKEYNKSLGVTSAEEEAMQLVGVYAFRKVGSVLRNFLKDVTRAGAAMTELNNRFSVIMQESTAEANKFAKEMANAYKLNELDLKNNILKFYTLAKNAGIASDQALLLTKRMSILATEIASVWDVDVQEASNSLISALQGLPKAMKRYGSYLGANELKDFLNSYRESKGLSKITGEMTRQQKVMAAYLKSLSDLGYSIGDFERTQGSVANQMKIMGETIKTMKQELGSVINTILEPVLSITSTVVKFISSMLKSLNRMPEAFKILTSIVILLVTVTPIILSSAALFAYYYGKAKKSIKAMATKYAPALTKWNIANAELIKRTVLSITYLGTFILSIMTAVDAFSDKTEEASKNMSETLMTTKDLKRTLASFDDVNAFDTSQGQDTSGFGIDFTDSNITEYLNDIGLVTDGVDGLNESLKKTNDVIGFISVAVGLLSGAMLIYNGLQTVAAIKSALLARAKAKETAVIVAQTAAQTALNVAKYIGLGLAGVAALVAISSVIKDTNKSTVSAPSLPSSPSYDEHDIGMPKLAHGSVVSSPTVAMVGEGRYNEAVVPLGQSPEFARMKSDIAEAVVSAFKLQNNKEQPINITVNVDEDYIYKTYNKVARQNGVM